MGFNTTYTVTCAEGGFILVIRFFENGGYSNKRRVFIDRDELLLALVDEMSKRES